MNGLGSSATETPYNCVTPISIIARAESWRKEVNRPNYHIHKWWAQRLGSIFRAIIIGAFAPADAKVIDTFYSSVQYPGKVIFDPFMGSGTTVGEALKLGAYAVGRDINPVAFFEVKNSVSMPDRETLQGIFREIENDTAPKLSRYYTTQGMDGHARPVLYYFWVRQVACPLCLSPVDLFSTYVFARHAYPQRHSIAQALCPSCGGINAIPHDASRAICVRCERQYHPQEGLSNGTHANCPGCKARFEIIRAAPPVPGGLRPTYRMYAKLILEPDGKKVYLPADENDRQLFDEARDALTHLKGPYPTDPILPGMNTNQAINHGFTHWYDMFNDRQLLCLSILAERIASIPDERSRDIFACLFSGILEFNNMFASYKGEGTGAVRHAFSHHILKPERTPIEANVWGTPKSSGSFTTLFNSRILRALDYRDNPFEIRVSDPGSGAKVTKTYGLSSPPRAQIATRFEDLAPARPVLLSCGDSGCSGLPDNSVDAIVTDPPFFDNVRYSELADFFYVWQKHLLGSTGTFSAASTRHPAEVQHPDPTEFGKRLAGVFRECNRVLKGHGIMVFTFHHSTNEGWMSLATALQEAGFTVTQSHPVKSELSVATPKHQAKEPIDFDLIIACRKANTCPSRPWPQAISPLEEAAARAFRQVTRLQEYGSGVGRNDIRGILWGQLLSRMPEIMARSFVNKHPTDMLREIDNAVDGLYNHIHLTPEAAR